MGEGGRSKGAAPSGAQHLLVLEGQEAVVTEVGASLRVYRVGARDVVVPYRRDEICPAMHGAVMLPWPNRLRDGRYTWDGRTYQLPLTEPARRVAHHGLAAWERWARVDGGDAHVTLRLDLVPTHGYPFPLRTLVTYRLTSDGLDVTLATTNAGDRDAPYGVGFHPWLSPGDGPLDAASLQCDAGTWVATDERLLPTGTHPVPPRLDYRTARPLAGAVLDDAYVDAVHTDGRTWVRLTGADGRTAAVWADLSVDCWQLCSGDADPGGPPTIDRTGLAAEPMTCVADAFVTGDRLVRLAPGETHTVRWGLTLR